MGENINLINEISISAEDTKELTINTPFDIDFQEVDNIILEQSTDEIKRLSIYPNGCIIYIEHTLTKILYRSNFEFVKIDVETYDLVNPK